MLCSGQPEPREQLPVISDLQGVDAGSTHDALERLMMAANQLGLFTIRKAPGGGDPRYSNNAASATLTDNHPSQNRAQVRLAGIYRFNHL